MASAPPGPGRFRYEDYRLDAASGELRCRYALGQHHFEERVRFPGGGDFDAPAADAAARLVFLLAGVSYYKTAAPPVLDLGDLATTAAERTFLRDYYIEGLGEFAYRNRLDLGGLRIEGPDAGSPAPAPYQPRPGRPLVPFGGGIDSVVTVESVRRRFSGAALFVVNRRGDRFDAIERPAAVTGLPVRRAERELDPQVLRSAELGFANGHVPVTGIISAIAVLAAVLDHRDAVVMSNEWSASFGNLAVGEAVVNHQYSKSAAFEEGFRGVLAGSVGGGLRYFSLLRPYSELWVARRFASLTAYHGVFRSCNRAFHLDHSTRLDRWCGQCDKCCFIDLILAPYLPAAALGEVFDGSEPLEDPALLPRFRALLGSGPEDKPFECVGDVDECRAALVLAAGRPDRAANPVLATLLGELGELGARRSAAGLLGPLGRHFIPDDYLPEGPDDGTPQDPLV